MQDVPYVQNYELSPIASFVATMIKFPEDNKSLAYKDLVCTEKDQAKIYEIITLMAEHGKIGLLFKKNYIENLGAQIQHVHPLKFLSTIVTHYYLRSCLDDIFDDYFKRGGFMDGIGPSLSREAEKGTLDQYIGDFAQEVHISQDRLTKYFRNHDWEDLVRLFIN